MPRQQGVPKVVGNPTDNRPVGSRTKGKLSGELSHRVREAIFYAVRTLGESPSRAQVEEAVRLHFRDVYSEWIARVPVQTSRLDYIGRVLRAESAGAKPRGRGSAGASLPPRPRAERPHGHGEAQPLTADLIPAGPADRLRLVAGSRPEPSVFEPGRRPWMYLYNRGGAVAEEIELFMGPSGHRDSTPVIGPGESAELHWPDPSYHPLPQYPGAKGGLVHFQVTYKTNGVSKMLAGNLQLDDDGLPVLLTVDPHGPEQTAIKIR